MAIDIIGEILKREGGYVNNPVDRGGATNFGVTVQTLRWWRKDPSADVRTLGESEAREILTALYIDKPKISQLPDKIKGFMADFSVHSGPYVAIQHLQRALGVTVDGVIGPETLAAVACGDPERLLRLIIASRVKMIAKLVQKAPSQVVFLGGWIERVLSFLV